MLKPDITFAVRTIQGRTEMTHFAAYILAPAFASLSIVAICWMTETKKGTPAYIRIIRWSVCLLAAFLIISGVMLTQELYIMERQVERVDQFVGHNTVIPDTIISHEANQD